MYYVAKPQALICVTIQLSFVLVFADAKSRFFLKAVQIITLKEKRNALNAPRYEKTSFLHM